MESSASRRRRGLVLLADAELDTNYTVSGIYERDRGLLEFLEHRGVRPGAKAPPAGAQLRSDANALDSGRHSLARPRSLRKSLVVSDSHQALKWFRGHNVGPGTSFLLLQFSRPVRDQHERGWNCVRNCVQDNTLRVRTNIVRRPKRRCVGKRK